MSDFNENTENTTPEEPQDTKKKFSDTQLRVFQAIAGLISAAALVLSLFLLRPSTDDSSSQGGLLQYTFLIVFLVIMFGRRWVENKFRLRLNFFSLVMIDGLMGGILLFMLFASQFSELGVWRTVILIGGTVLLLAFGIGMPLLRYLKRKKEGTVPPIRVPEKKQDPEKKAEESHGPSTIDQQIAEMMRELDGVKSEENLSEDKENDSEQQ